MQKILRKILLPLHLWHRFHQMFCPVQKCHLCDRCPNSWAIYMLSTENMISGNNYLNIWNSLGKMNVTANFPISCQRIGGHMILEKCHVPSCMGLISWKVSKKFKPLSDNSVWANFSAQNLDASDTWSWQMGQVTVFFGLKHIPMDLAYICYPSTGLNCSIS